MNRQPIVVPKITALYERLSKDDEQRNESVSIANQKRILEDYARKNGFGNIRHFVDDGVTGTVFNRPGLNAMVDEVKAGNVATVIVKDQSRIGRDVLEVGLLKRTFVENGVRFIAAEDGLDTAKGFDIMSIMRDVINEFYVADSSRKITAVFRSKGESGKHMTNTAIYGYRKNPDDKEKNEWLIDDEAAAVVRRIFRMTIDGMGPYQIARTLTDEKITRPREYVALRDGREILDTDEKCYWRGSTVTGIIAKPEYMGHTVNFRTSKESYKDKHTKRKPEEEWVIFENTQEPIIDAETWATAQKCREVKRRTTAAGTPNMLTGLVICADCGRRMHNRRGANPIYDSQDNYTCQSYFDYPHKCTLHHIKTSTLRTLALDAICKVNALVRDSEEEFIQLVSDLHDIQSVETAKAQKKQLAQYRKRHRELDSTIKQLYEDKVKGKLAEKRFGILCSEFESEQAELELQIAETQASLDAYDDGSGNTARFIEMVRKYTDVTELTPAILNEYIDKIVVHEAVKEEWRREQQVDIYFKFVGRIPLPPPEAPVLTERQLKDKESDRRYYYKNREAILARKREREARIRASKNKSA